MRSLLVVWHRWFGLAAAGFLFFAGLTGAIIAWDHELDGWLNPQLFEARTAGPGRPALALAEQYEKEHPDFQVTWLLLQRESGESQELGVALKPGHASGEAVDQVWLDPVTGKVQGQRQWGELSLARQNLLPLIYRFHYSLVMPNVGAINPGIWCMGLLAMAWIIDCFAALWLSFPKLVNWRKSLAFRWSQGGYKLTFDLHRSTGVWVWLLLLGVAVSSVCLNLPQVARAAVGVVSKPGPSPYERALPKMAGRSVLTREQAVTLVAKEASRRGWQTPMGGIFHFPPAGIYGVGFFAAGQEHGDAGLGNVWIYIDDHDGSLINVTEPGSGTAGDIFMQLQFPLHSGRIIGLPGRILVSLLGLGVALLSVTGVLIWARKRRARLAQSEGAGKQKAATRQGAAA